MNKSLQQPSNQVTESKDPAYIIALHDIADARNLEELKQATSKGLAKFDEFSQNYKF